MEQSQSDLCIEVLRRLDKAGLLKDIILVGSWCTLFYKDFFGDQEYMTPLVTRDMDLFIPHPRAIRTKTDVAELLKDIGFVVGFTGSQGYIRLEHPQLIVEFLVPEKGRGSDKPYALPQLGLNAQALRFLEFLSQNTITVKLGSTIVTLPHPANFALHKLLIMSRRPQPEKQAKDKEAAIRILNTLVANGQANTLREAFDMMPKRWQGKVKKQLTDITEKHLVEILE
ncbi:MAG: nucleotidyltransferase domain-containing protein [Phycisphaerae bacterium]|nr:nucleotidyltransferase domain-containing protein [Phycisphaerae bacterium]